MAMYTETWGCNSENQYTIRLHADRNITCNTHWTIQCSRMPKYSLTVHWVLQVMFPECRRKHNLKTHWTIQCSRMLKYSTISILCLQIWKLNTSCIPTGKCFRREMNLAWDCFTTPLLGHHPHQESRDVGSTQTMEHSLCWLRTVKVVWR
jgi:hypothetical protein